MQRQLDESIKVTTMSMDISIDEDSWNSSSQHNDRSSSTLNLTYDRKDTEEDHGDEDEREDEPDLRDEVDPRLLLLLPPPS